MCEELWEIDRNFNKEFDIFNLSQAIFSFSADFQDDPMFIEDLDQLDKKSTNSSKSDEIGTDQTMHEDDEW